MYVISTNQLIIISMINYFISLDSKYLPMIIYSSAVLMFSFAFEIASLGMKYNLRDEAILLGYNACICIFTWLIDITDSLFSRRLCLLGCSLLLVFFYELSSNVIMYSEVDYKDQDNQVDDEVDDEDDEDNVVDEDNQVDEDSCSEVDNQDNQDNQVDEDNQDNQVDEDNQDNQVDEDNQDNQDNSVPKLEMETDLDNNNE